MIKFLEFLQNNKGEWVYKNNDLTIHSENLFSEYWALIDAIDRNESTIQTLSKALIEGVSLYE